MKKLTDEQLIERINKMIADGKPRNTILKSCGAGYERILLLEKSGAVVLPKGLTPTEAARQSAKKSGWKNNFRLAGSPRF